MSEKIVISEDSIEVNVSPKTKVVMRSLNGADIRSVNKITGQNYGNAAENQVLFSIVSVNGEDLVPARNDMHLEDRARRFSGREYISLIEEYGKAFYEDLSDPK
jgi:hypothetical protein